MVDEQRGGGVRESERERERGVTTSGTNTGPWLYTGLCIYVMPDSTSISSGFNLNVIAVPVIASS